MSASQAINPSDLRAALDDLVFAARSSVGVPASASAATSGARAKVEELLNAALAEERRATAATIHERTDKTDAELTAIRAALAEHEQRIRLHPSGRLSVTERLNAVVRWLDCEVEQTHQNAAQFRDDLLTYLRALVIVAETIGNAGTHREKDARLRGLIEVLESGAKRLRALDFKRAWSFHDWPDVMRSDYPVRQAVQRIHELEAELARVTGQPQPERPLTPEEIPF